MRFCFRGPNNMLNFIVVPTVGHGCTRRRFSGRVQVPNLLRVQILIMNFSLIPRRRRTNSLEVKFVRTKMVIQRVYWNRRPKPLLVALLLTRGLRSKFTVVTGQ